MSGASASGLISLYSYRANRWWQLLGIFLEKTSWISVRWYYRNCFKDNRTLLGYSAIVILKWLISWPATMLISFHKNLNVSKLRNFIFGQLFVLLHIRKAVTEKIKVSGSHKLTVSLEKSKYFMWNPCSGVSWFLKNLYFYLIKNKFLEAQKMCQMINKKDLVEYIIHLHF